MSGSTQGSASEAANPIKGEGRFSTGETAASHRVMITCRGAGLDIAFETSEAPRFWHYDTLTADAPLRSKTQDILLGCSTDPKAHLFISDPAVLAVLRSNAHQLSPGRMRGRNARPWIFATLSVILLVAGIWASGISPASMLARLLPERARLALGEQAVTSMIGTRRQCTDDAGVKALERLATRLASDGTFPHFDITVVDWDLMNAFAVPGDKIVLTRGLLNSADDADEVAGVLAHEMGHGILRHPETAFVRALGLAAAAEIMLGGTGGALANIGIVLAQLSYSRLNEREADESALTLLRDAKISPKGFGRFFDRILKDEAASTQTPAEKKTAIERAASLLRSHPPTEERRRMVSAAAPYPSTPALTPADWKALKSICGQN